MRDAVDFMDAPDPAQLQQLELDALVYTGNARPSLEWVNDCRARGVCVTFIQETYSTRSTEGYAVGVGDCRFAESRAKEYGHSGSIAVVVSDGNYADRWDASEYGRGWSDTATLPFFAYGAHGVIDSFYAGALQGRGAGLIVPGTDGQPGRWVPETWGPTNLIGQVVGPSPVPSSDLDHVHADYTGAAPVPVPPTRKKPPTMFVSHVLATQTCDLWSESPVKLDVWQNTDNPNQYGIGEKLARYVEMGIPVVTYATVGDYQNAYNDLMRQAGHYPGPGTT